jgi:hypothetical protein
VAWTKPAQQSTPAFNSVNEHSAVNLPSGVIRRIVPQSLAPSGTPKVLTARDSKKKMPAE